ncbi:lipopolysaccharide biosynthesis protein [Marinobacter sp. BGYM27]|uniref:lipopolysaccharide biosynthesis protein n=1 Tax=Marinobacter sp. BGYM27 TaxID=2975597 RepID=UPI0021A84357|nr:lipopolysaccharide biosynthesis protein [Marinobacter sp. BGYM27]MDG5499219.1 lipopolysaccharide biosynthesis protein [Marinobacter sp. BGYM27]
MNARPDRAEVYDHEISLVDLAAVLVRRRRYFYTVFVLVFGVGLAWALLAPAQYQYISLFQTAQTSSNEYVESPATTIAVIKSRWLPEAEADYYKKNGKSLAVGVTLTNPEGTGLVRLESEAASDAKSAVASLHQFLLDNMQESLQAKIKQKKASLEQNLAATQRVVEKLMTSENGGNALAAAFDRQSSLQGKLDSLTDTSNLTIARASSEPIGPKRILIVVVSILLALMAGVFFAFMAEFFGRVRRVVRSNPADY